MAGSPTSSQKSASRRIKPALVPGDAEAGMPGRPALVLGERGAAELIARSLRAEGFAAETSGEPLPSLSDPEALQKVRGILTRFAERSRGRHGAVVHPGVSVWAERPEIATLGEELGLDVICPPSRHLALFANKLNLLGEADRLGIPHLVMGFDPIYSMREIERLVFNQALARKTFPFVLKAVKGGGSFGVHVVQEAGDLERKIPIWVEQVRRNLGEVALFGERYLEGARHVLVPFARYPDGRFEAFPMTDASLQSRYRKIVEFCPAAGLDPEAIDKLVGHTQRFADHVGYVGVGTLEYLIDGPRVFLVEGQARLNTAFHLWERVAGTSAVAWQLSTFENSAPGREPRRSPRREWSAGVALRIYAEDPLLQIPQPGEVREASQKREWRFTNPNLGVAAELDLQVEPGSRLGPLDYGMVGLLWAGAEDPAQALKVARGALDEVWIAGSLQTNERFLSELLAHPWVREGMFHAGFVDEEFLPTIRPPEELLAAFAGALSDVPGLPAAAPGATVRWVAGDQWVKQQKVRWLQGPEHWEKDGRPGVSGVIELADGRSARVCAYPLADNKWQVRVGAWVLSVRRVARLPGEKPRRAPRLYALVHGRVHAMLYREGAIVPAHEPLLILDSLGMLVPHALPVEARIVSWKTSAESIVEAGAELAELEVISRD